MAKHDHRPDTFFDGDGVGWNMEPNEQAEQPYRGYTRDRTPALAIVVGLVVLLLLVLFIGSHLRI